VDEVLLSYMAGPHTYTREDVVEINCHSGFMVLSQILELVLRNGARLAEPGEFTRRAFLSGRIDLSQAEAVLDVIHSRSQQSLKLAGLQLRGDFRNRVLEWREQLLRLQTVLEAFIDFGDDLDEDASESSFSLHLLEEELISPLQHMIDTYESGRILREGFTLVLVGKPNVGKSSLLNVLLGKDRAIVTHLPGTTRDVIEDSFLLSGVLVKILDTAGIRLEPDAIESIGIERTLASIGEADAVLWLIDQSRQLTDDDDKIFRTISELRHIIILNKSDLSRVVSADTVKRRYGSTSPVLNLSVFDPVQIDKLREFLADTFLRRPLERNRSALIPNLRHKVCFEEALASLQRARELLVESSYSELVSLEFHSARRSLGSVLGLEADEDLLDSIFSNFCIGK
jgi:tRNA modification GTPase